MVIEINKNNKINKQQNKQIADLQRKVGQLKLLANMPRKARRTARKRLQRTTDGGRHPLHDQAVALLQPFKSINGVAQHLVDALPSQKYTVRSRASAAIAASGCMFGFLSPYCYQDADRPSGMIWTATSVSAAETSTDLLYESSVTGSSSYPTGWNASHRLDPVRPYVYSGAQTARLVSYGLRIRYTGAALYASGTFKMLATPHGELHFVDGTNMTNVLAILQGSPATQMKSIYDKAVYEFNFIGNDQWSGNGTGADQDEDVITYRVGKATCPTYMSEPGAVFYYVNNSANAVNFEIELVENWEVRGPSVAPFYTDSHTDPALHHEIINVVNTAHQKAGLSTATKFTDVVSSVSRASRSPLGKAVLAAALA